MALKSAQLSMLGTIAIVGLMLAGTAAWSLGSQQCGAEAEFSSPYKKGAFLELGLGFNPQQADCLLRESPQKNAGVRRRVVKIPFSSTTYNREAFCNQDFFIPFGAQCLQEPQKNYQINALQSKEDVDEFFGQSLPYSQISADYCSTNPLKRELIQSRIPAAAERDAIILAESYVVHTHYTPELNFCGSDLTEEFRAAVANLPLDISEEVDEAAYLQLAHQFGTNVVNRLTLGGLAIQISEHSENFPPRSPEDFLRDPNTKFIGGDNELIAQATNPDQQYAVWLETLPHLPQTLSYGLLPITDFVDELFFPQDDQIDTKKSNLIAVLSGTRNTCFYHPVSEGPHLQLLLTDDTVVDYTIGQTFQAPPNVFIQNLKVLGRFEEFSNIMSWEFSSDDHEYDYYVYGSGVEIHYDFLDSINYENWLLDTANTAPIDYIWVETTFQPHQGTIIMTFSDTQPWLDYDTWQNGYDFQLDIYDESYSDQYADWSYLKIDYIKCVPSIPIEEADFQIQWNDLSVTFHQFNEQAQPPKAGLLILDIVLMPMDNDRISGLRYYTSNLDYEQDGIIDTANPGAFQRDDDDIYQEFTTSINQNLLQTFKIVVNFGTVVMQTVNSLGQSIVSEALDQTTFAITNTEGFSNIRITVQGQFIPQ